MKPISTHKTHSLKMWKIKQVCKNNFIDAKFKVKLMTTAYYRSCTNVKMIVTINSDENDENEVTASIGD